MRVAPSSCGFQRGCVGEAAADSLPPPTGRPWALAAGVLPPLDNGPGRPCRLAVCLQTTSA